LVTAGADASANAGSYAITASGATGGTFNPANYAINYVNGALTINPQTLTITANDVTQTHNNVPYSGGNGVTYIGFVNGQNPSVLSGTIMFGGNSQGAVNVGTYTIIPSGQTASNYAINYLNGTLTINPAPITVTLNPPPITVVLDSLATAANIAGTTSPSRVMNATVLPTVSSLPGNPIFGGNAVLPYGNDPGAIPVNTNLQTFGGVGMPSQPRPPSPGARNLPTGLERRIIDIPPLSVTDLVNDEVVMHIATTRTVAEVEDAVRSLGLTLLASENLAITQSIVMRFRITDGRTPRDILQALRSIQLIAIAQPNYIFRFQQQGDDATPALRGETGPKGDAAQYILEKLKISDVHRMVRGTNVPIAMIDSEIDATHPDLEGVIAQHFSAVGAPEKPHAHGTGMAGAIASHQRLLGTAPGARLLLVHAFTTTAATGEGTTFNILKGIDWSVRQGARIINMSFAGPKDPSLERALKAAYDKGIVLVAAAGNAGPKSPPLFPGADPYVIAVTATDVDDKLFSGANRGKYISVAAPGVDILVPAPEGEYQMTTGTSVAAAEVSGIVALLLERNPKLTPADIRRILTMSARRLAPGERDDNFGSGLINPMQALQLANPRSATTTPPPPARPIRQR
jgi:Subtilase family/MBG domain (YGX type)